MGCGTGFVLEKLQGLGYEGWGLDSSKVAVGLCEQRGLTTVTKGILGSNLSQLSEKSFDMITFLDVIEHIDQDLELLSTAKQYLKSEGLILITVPAYQFLWSSHDQAHGHKRCYKKSQVVELCQQAGYEVIFASYFNTFLFPLVAIARLAGNFRKYLQKAENSSDAKPAPIWLNGLLEKVFRSEQYLLPKFSLPFGVSIICVARIAN